MKVSSKIGAGFLILMLLAMVVLGNQLSVIHQMQRINRDLSEIDMNAASTVLRLEELGRTIQEDSQKYFVASDPIYDRQIDDLHQEFLERIASLQKTARSDHERAEIKNLSIALDNYWNVFNRSKKRNQRSDADYLPVDLAIAVDHLQRQTEAANEAVKASIND